MGATVGLAAKGLLPDSSVPSTSSRGPATPVQDASIQQTMTAPRAIDSIGMTVLPGVDFVLGFRVQGLFLAVLQPCWARELLR